MIPIEQRFWAKVQVKGLDECWEWTGARSENGYGKLNVRLSPLLSSRAHRTAYVLTHGPISEGMHILHRCDNRACCNPTHIFQGSRQDNMDDMVNKDRSTKGARNSQTKLTEDQVMGIRKDTRSQESIGKSYGVSRRLVGMIKSRQRWGWL